MCGFRPGVRRRWSTNHVLRSELMADLRMIIGGDEVEAVSGLRTDVIDPATERVVGSVPKGGLADVDRAVEAARRGLQGLVAPHAGRTGGAAGQACRSARRRDRAAGRDRGLADRQADQAGRQLRRSLRQRQPSLHGRTGPHPRGIGGRRVRRRVHQHHPAGAAGSGGLDRPVELPLPDGGLEGRAGAGGRQHGHPQAGVEHAR